MQTKVDASKLELTEEIVDIRRVAKTVKGGRNMRFSVTVVVGDGEGHVGMGLGKAIEIPEAVRKATEDAKKKMIYVPTVGTTASSCLPQRVQALSLVHPYVQYLKQQESRT